MHHLKESPTPRILMQAKTLQSTSADMAMLTPNLPPMPAHATKLPLCPPRPRRTSPCGVIGERGFGEEGLHDAI